MSNSSNIIYGGWLMLGNPQIAEIMDQSNIFDNITIDMQHSTITDREMENILSRIKCEKCVRLLKSDENLICKALDAGADHIIIPNVTSIRDVTFPRSYGLYRSRGYGFEERENTHKILAQIEYPISIEVARDIFDLVDGYMIGPYDMKEWGGTYEDELKYLKLAKEMNKIRGYHIVFPKENIIREKINLGYNFLVLGTDCIAIGEWCRKWEK